MKLKDILLELLDEQQDDRCLRIARRKYDKPSAYRSGAIVQCRKGKIWKGLKEDEEAGDSNIAKYNDDDLIDSLYIPFIFKPDTSSLNKEEHDLLLNDLRNRKLGLIDYILFAKSMSDDEPIYKSILDKLVKSNVKKLNFTLDQDEMLNSAGLVKLKKFKELYEKYKGFLYNFRYNPANRGSIDWADENKFIYDEILKRLNVSLNEDESLHKWFSRKGAGGKSKGWVDCNTCKEDPKTGRKKCKPCGRQKGENRAKYPSCRPTPSRCEDPGKGKKWGKTNEDYNQSSLITEITDNQILFFVTKPNGKFGLVPFDKGFSNSYKKNTGAKMTTNFVNSINEFIKKLNPNSSMKAVLDNIYGTVRFVNIKQ